MKKNRLWSLLLLIVLSFSLSLKAQERNDTTSALNNIVYKDIPKKLNIKDKIIVQNKSPYYILQIVVALPFENGDMQTLGSATYIAPNETYVVASYDNNYLKQLRGRTIAIKTKGAKIIIGETNQTSVWTPFGSVGVKHKELSPEIINKISPNDITYQFDAKLYEANHDLYIELTNSNGKGVMDF